MVVLPLGRRDFPPPAALTISFAQKNSLNLFNAVFLFNADDACNKRDAFENNAENTD